MRDMEDGEEAECAWNSPIEKGFISNGNFVIPDSIENVLLPQY